MTYPAIQPYNHSVTAFGQGVGVGRVAYSPRSQGDSVHFGNGGAARTAAKSLFEGIQQDPNSWQIIKGLGLMAASAAAGVFAVSNPIGWMAAVVLIPASIGMAAKGSAMLDKLSHQPNASKGALSYLNQMRTSWFSTNRANAQQLILGYNKLVQSLVGSDALKRRMLLNPRKGIGALIRKAMRIKGHLGQQKLDKAEAMAEKAAGRSPQSWLWRLWNALGKGFVSYIQTPMHNLMKRLPLVRGPVMVFGSLWSIGRIAMHWFSKAGRLKKPDPDFVKTFVESAKRSRLG